MIFYPLNKIKYNAEDAQLFNCTRTSGIYSTDDFRCEVSGLDNNVTVNLGLGWIRLDRFRGGVFALREMAETVDLGIADETLPRIDVVGVQFSANNNSIKVFTKKGTPASEPKIPAIVKTPDTYELYFCAVKRPAGAIEITADMVTDLRLNNDYCGLMADSITKVDTVAINNQITALIDKLDEEIKKVHDGSAWLLKSEVPAYIVEEHIAESNFADWSYRKYNNGIAECWRTWGIYENCTEPWGTLYTTVNKVLFFDYPFTFSERPQDTISIIESNFDVMLVQGKITNTTSKPCGYALARPTSQENIKAVMSIHTIGRWK